MILVFVCLLTSFFKASTDLQQPSGPQGLADSQLAHSKRDDVPPPPKDGQPPKPKDHDHDKRGDVPPPPKDGKDPQPPKHN